MGAQDADRNGKRLRNSAKSRRHGSDAQRPAAALVERRGVREPALLEALAAVPRMPFVEASDAEHDKQARRPVDLALEVPPPDLVGHFVRLLELGAARSTRLLVIGASTGYLEAVLSHLVREVVALAATRRAVERIRARCAELGIDNVHVEQAPLADGLPARAPYHRMLVLADIGEPAKRLLEQLATGGKLLALRFPLGRTLRFLKVVRRGPRRFDHEELSGKTFVPLIGDVLVASGVCTRAEVERVAEQALAREMPLGQLLIQDGLADEGEIYRALARQRGLRTGSVEALLLTAEKDLFERYPRPFLRHNRLLPIRRKGKVLVVATCDPDVRPRDLAHILNVPSVEVHLLSPTDFRRIVAAFDLGYTGSGGDDGEEPGAATQAPEQVAISAEMFVGDGTLESQFVQLFDALLLDAIGERASDLHLEVYDGEVRVRFRVDGCMRDVPRYRLSARELVGLVNVVKVSADLDIAERRLPQGGRIRRRIGARNYDLRVQTQPALHGEHVVIRILPQDRKLLGIEELGFSKEMADAYRRLLVNPQGLVLVVGPTGSGKSTTLYAGLQLLAKDASRKVITVEDPIEYSMRGIQQCAVRPEIGFDFADAIRAFLREDPDVILVGEIRDNETALEGIRASQTGHLVLSTLHANDTVDAVQRLFDLGLHPNSIASELVAVISQRLARRICPACRRRVEDPAAVLAEVFPDGAPEGLVIWEGAGCGSCSGYGTRGRVAVVELLHVGRELRRAISRQPLVDELRELAIEIGLVPMRDSALRLVRDGVIPVTELPRVLSAEQLAAIA